MSDQTSKIEQLKKGLYSRKGEDILHKEVRFKEHHNDVEGEWKGDPEPETPESEPENEQYEAESSSFFRNILWAAVIFFIIALGFAFYILYGGKNVVSADNVNILVAGPVSVAGGDPLSLDIKVENNNNVKLQLVDLSIEFPSGTASPTDVTQAYPRYRELIGDIVPRDSATKKINVILFGEENSKKSIKITAEYRVEGSNAVFSKEKDYDIVISSSPVSMTVDSLKEVNANQQADFTLTISSNSAQTVRNLLVRGEYPFGFSFKNSNPKPTYDNNVWKIGDLPPGTKKVIKVSGVIEGQDEQERVFRFNLGTVSPHDDKTIGTAFMTALQPILVKKPFVTTSLALNGDSANLPHAAVLDTPIRADIAWTNNTSGDVIDSVIKVKLSGAVLDKTSVNTDSGFYRSSDNTITWDKTTASDLAVTHSGGSGHVGFTFTPKVPSFIDAAGLRSPEIGIDINVQGRRVSEGNVPETIVSTVTRQVKISPILGFASRLVRSTGPFTNTGPFPPKADKESTYTVIWTLTDTSSNVANTQVKAILPSYARWVGKISPEQESLIYDAVSGGVTWNPGVIAAGTGYSLPPREVAFQVAFTPSVTQVGQTPTLLGDATAVGQDIFTGTMLQNVKGALNTRLNTDPLYKAGDEQVQE